MILKVKQNENPYDIIGNYIEKHIPVIDDIIAVISIDGEIRNELLLVEISSTNNFVWQIDWWEGEENVELIDFFFVSDACKKNNNNDLISRQQVIDALGELPTFTQDWSDNTWMYTDDVYDAIKQLSPIQSEIVRCKDCKYWNSGSCEYPEHAVNCQDYWVGDIETEAEHFCGYAKRREVTE